ncbi:MAG: branched-chain amino acid ABC transporter permease [Acidimicrobiia bacterium]
MADATGIFHTSYRRDLALRHTRAEWIRLVFIGAVAVALPFQLDSYWLQSATRLLILAIAVVGLMVLTGYTGLVSLATGAFLGVGAFATANVASRYGLPVPVGIAFGTVVAALIGAFFGLPALRLKGLYLAITTLAAQYILSYTFRNWDYLTDGAGNIAAKAPCLGGTGKQCVGGTKLDSDFVWYWIALVCLAVVVMAVRNLFRTGLGRAFIAIRDQDIAAEVIGVHVGRYKILAFALACGLAGFSGALNAHWRNVVTWERYEIDQSFLAVAMIIIGGLGSVAGAVYGAGFMIFLESYIQRLGQELRSSVALIGENVPELQLFVFGAVIVLFLLFEPRGLARLWQRAKDYFRLWPFRY